VSTVCRHQAICRLVGIGVNAAGIPRKGSPRIEGDDAWWRFGDDSFPLGMSA
jgi:hypothetical protein